jgi:hypothetical protein
MLTALDNKRKELKADAKAIVDGIDGEAREIKKLLEGLQSPHKQAYKKLDQDKKDYENKRREDLEQRVADIRDLPYFMSDSHSSEVLQALTDMKVNECEGFGVMEIPACKARNDAIITLGEMYETKIQEEKDKVELEELRKLQYEREVEDKAKALIEKERVEVVPTEEPVVISGLKVDPRTVAKDAIICLGVPEEHAITTIKAVCKGHIPYVRMIKND